MVANATSAVTTAPFVFKGTVEESKARQVVVRVDEVLKGSGALADLTGHSVVVDLKRQKPTPKGRQMIFHTAPVTFGDRVVVQAVRQEPATAAAAAGSAPDV